MTGSGNSDDWDGFLAREPARTEGTDWLRSVGPGAARRPLRRRRTTYVLVAAAVATVLLLLLAVYGLTRGIGDSEDESPPAVQIVASVSASRSGAQSPQAGNTPAPTAASSQIALPSGATTSRPPGIEKAEAAPPISPDRAFPAQRITLPSGAVYDRIDVYTPADCREMTSGPMADVIQQGRGCAQLTVALYSDPARKTQITVAVMSMNHASEAATVFAMASTDPIRFQVGALDPPAGSDVPLPPRASPGDFARIMTVRSVVFSIALWTDGRDVVSEEITGPAAELLKYVNDIVAAEEEAVVRS
ncbi:hypothetical protein OG216_40615 [Streptomycetaceae bacterium NBC_01309]